MCCLNKMETEPPKRQSLEIAPQNRQSILKWQQLIRAGSAVFITVLVIVGFIYSIFLGNKPPDLHSIIKITDTIARIAYVNGSEITEDLQQPE